MGDLRGDFVAVVGRVLLRAVLLLGLRFRNLELERISLLILMILCDIVLVDVARDEGSS